MRCVTRHLYTRGIEFPPIQSPRMRTGKLSDGRAHVGAGLQNRWPKRRDSGEQRLLARMRSPAPQTACASRSMGSFAFGMPAEAFNLEAGPWGSDAGEWLCRET